MGKGYDEEAARIGSLLHGRSRYARIKFVLLFIGFAAAGMLIASYVKGEELVGTATHITDGDTLRLCGNGRCQSIRLCGINAPESNEDGFEAARASLTAIVGNKQIACRPVGEGTACDGRSKATSFHRIVAQCFTDDGTDIASSLLRLNSVCECVNFSGGGYRSRHCRVPSRGCGT